MGFRARRGNATGFVTAAHGVVLGESIYGAPTQTTAIPNIGIVVNRLLAGLTLSTNVQQFFRVGDALHEDRSYNKCF